MTTVRIARESSHKSILITLTCIFLSSGVSAAPSAKELPQSLASILAEQGIPISTLSLVVQEVNANEPIVAVNTRTLRQPASLAKLFTTFIALDYLGPGYQWHTEIFASDSILDGSTRYLLFKGSGDPYLTKENLWFIVNELQNLGLESIEDGLFVDQSYFEANQSNSGDFDNDPLRPYNLMPSALLANFNMVDFTLVPNSATGSVDISFNTLPTSVIFDNQMKLGKGHCPNFMDSVAFNETQSNKVVTISVEGYFPEDCPKIEHELSLTNTNHYFHSIFSDFWHLSGGELQGYIAEQAKKKNLEKPLLVYKSPPLTEIIRRTNKESNNFMSRQIFLTLGNHQQNKVATLEQSRMVVRSTLDKYGIDFQDQFIDNGSGLSRQNLVRAETVSQLLMKIYQHPLRAEFVSSLPISGIDGTIKKRFKKFPLKERMHLKTGTIDGVQGLAGYVQGLSGKEYIVVFMHNDFSEFTYKTKPFQDAFLTWVVQDHKW